MASLFDVSAEAQNDLFEIWRHIAGDSVELANRIESEFYELFASLDGCEVRDTHAKILRSAPSCFCRCTRFWWYINPARNLSA